MYNQWGWNRYTAPNSFYLRTNIFISGPILTRLKFQFKSFETKQPSVIYIHSNQFKYSNGPYKAVEGS